MKKPPYEKNSLEENIKKCRETITMFQRAIEKEYESIARLEQCIREIEEWERFIGSNHGNNI